MSETLSNKYQCSVCGMYRDPETGREFYERGSKAEDISLLKKEIEELKTELSQYKETPDNGNLKPTGKGIIDRIFGE